MFIECRCQYILPTGAGVLCIVAMHCRTVKRTFEAGVFAVLKSSQQANIVQCCALSASRPLLSAAAALIASKPLPAGP